MTGTAPVVFNPCWNLAKLACVLKSLPGAPKPSRYIWLSCLCHPSGLPCVVFLVKHGCWRYVPVRAKCHWCGPQHFRLIPEIPCHDAESIVWDSFNFILAKAGLMFRNHDRSRRKWLAQDYAGGLGVKCRGSSALLSPSLCVSPGTLSPTQKHMKLCGLRIFPFALTAEKSWRLTKPLKLINFSCACRDIDVN